MCIWVKARFSVVDSLQTTAPSLTQYIILEMNLNDYVYNKSRMKSHIFSFFEKYEVGLVYTTCLFD